MLTTDCLMSTKKEVNDATSNKKNGKFTTDWKNELLKQGGDEMVEFAYLVIKAFCSGTMAL